MSSVSAESASQPSSASMADSPVHNRLLDRVMTFAGDHLNPILVKETRQALKSKQFVITFALLLILAWAWSLLGVALIGPGVFYSANGPGMFFVYFIILAFPLLVIVPFSAFRSLTGEWEDNTYELMSITGLNPRQIVSGKLGSSALQMVIYLSAISPCLAFTYMLRGIDFPTILMIITYLVFGSLGLSLLGLLAGTLVSQKHWQVIMSVAVVIGLLFTFWGGYELCYELLYYSGISFDDSGFWIANGAMLTAYLSYFALLFFAAAAQLTFSSDNRTTRMRIVMVLQHVLLTGWFAGALFEFGFAEEAMIAYLVMAGVHWYVMGACMSSEAAELSLRIKRNLPQSFLGRVFLTWFNPGPGTGYILAISGMLAAMAMALSALLFFGIDMPFTPSRAFAMRSAGTNAHKIIFAFAFIGLFYIVIFLGLGMLVLRLARRVSPVGVVLAVLVQILLLLVGCGVPLMIQLMSPTLRDLDYSMLQLTNPFWTLVYMADSWRGTRPETEAILWCLGIMAFLVFLANFGSVAREVRHVRIMRPKRVAEEDAEKAALKAPPVSTKTSPWDD